MWIQLVVKEMQKDVIFRQWRWNVKLASRIITTCCCLGSSVCRMSCWAVSIEQRGEWHCRVVGDGCCYVENIAVQVTRDQVAVRNHRKGKEKLLSRFKGSGSRSWGHLRNSGRGHKHLKPELCSERVGAWTSWLTFLILVIFRFLVFCIAEWFKQPQTPYKPGSRPEWQNTGSQGS